MAFSPMPAAIDAARRRFITGAALGGALAGLGRSPWAWAVAAPEIRPLAPAQTIDLELAETEVAIGGLLRRATTVNGSLPGPLLRWREGEEVLIRVHNRLSVSSSIHWHGILLPAAMDGVPGVSFPGIAPGVRFHYRFRPRQSGTYWYHSHSGFQEQTGLYGPLVIEPARPAAMAAYQRDYVVMLNDWSEQDPATIFATLKRQSDAYNFALPDASRLWRDIRREGLNAALARRHMWNRMRMNPTDLSDVSGATYTYLLNGQPPGRPWQAPFRPGERLRLRFINASAMTIFDVRIPGLTMTVIAADGQPVAPVAVDEFRISVAETYDVLVELADARAFAVFAQAIDRSGYALGELSPHPELRAEVPPLDPRPRLAAVDMMGAMAGDASPWPVPTPPVHHARSESGPGVGMQVAMPRGNLDDPGVGLRRNGRRVLSYADLHTEGGPLDPRLPEREIELHLTGNMQRYMWSFDGLKYSQARPIHFRLGERLRIVLVNDTVMNHPIHLHGMWSELESPDGRFQVRKHTINVQPAQRISYRVTAHAPGRWAYHCHMLYHMQAGMFREVVVA